MGFLSVRVGTHTPLIQLAFARLCRPVCMSTYWTLVSSAKCSEISLETAKKQACIMLGEIAKGNDPKSGKRINSLNDITLREVLQKFLETKPLRKDTDKT